jgi:hypothetical protein
MIINFVQLVKRNEMLDPNSLNLGMSSRSFGRGFRKSFLVY